ncbi:unnamed protein product [Closterium sp. NIES-53]
MTRTNSCITGSPPTYSPEKLLDESTPRSKSLEPNPTVSQLMAKAICLEADITTQEFKLYNGKVGHCIGKSVLKNKVFVLEFTPDQGTADSDAIVNFTTWSHPPDLDPDFSPGGFWSRDNSSSSNIGSSKDNNSNCNIGRSRSNNNITSTNHKPFISTNSRHRYHTDSHSTADSRSTTRPQKR